MRSIVLLIVAGFLFSCSEKHKEEITLSYTEFSLQRDSVSINLPEFKHGFPFVAYDSIDYINIYVLNDSTIQVNEKRFELVDFVEDPNWKYPRNFPYTKDTDSLSSYLEKFEMDSSVFNIFIDTSNKYEIVKNLFQSLINSSLIEKNYINVIGENNSFIPVIDYKFGGGCTMSPAINERNILHIKLNVGNQIIINNEVKNALENIYFKTKQWYTNPQNDEWLPRMNEFSETSLRENIAILKYNIESSTRLIERNSINNELEKWCKKLETQQLIGDYRTVKQAAIILIQIDKELKTSKFSEVLDKINQGVLELRNDLCEEKFNIKYQKLNLNLLKDKIIKSAIDEVYPIKTVVTDYIFDVPLPPPPPPLPN